MFWLLAQLVEPALQPGPVRLPANAPIERQQQKPESPGLELSPELQDSKLLGPEALQQQLDRCNQNGTASSPYECAAALTAQLVARGFVNSRILLVPQSIPPRLELVEGRLVELRIQSSSKALAQRSRRWLEPLQRGALHLPSLEEALQKLRQRPEVASVRGGLGRLGSDPAKAVLNLTVEPANQPLTGEISLRNDGNPGTGEARGLFSASKTGILQANDQFLLYGEINTDQDPEIGYALGSLSYTAQINQKLSFTGAFGISRRNLVEALQPYHDISYRQLQGYGQFNWNLVDGLQQQWFAFAGLSLNRNDAFLKGDAVPLVYGSNDPWLRTGFLRAGVSFNGSAQSLAWGGQIYGLQGIAGFSTPDQQRSLAEVGVQPGEARAIGASLAASWLALPKLLITARGAAQLAFNPLTNDMGFSLGSDSGIRGLPGQLISGDSGLLGNLEFAYSIWKGKTNRLQLVPFIGAGQIQSNRDSFYFFDTAGAGGVLARWWQGNRWSLELGWVAPFQTEEQSLWKNWMLSNGLYSQLKLRF
jgi:hemolysin activation/secretion protein